MLHGQVYLGFSCHLNEDRPIARSITSITSDVPLLLVPELYNGNVHV